MKLGWTVEPDDGRLSAKQHCIAVGHPRGQNRREFGNPRSMPFSCVDESPDGRVRREYQRALISLSAVRITA